MKKRVFSILLALALCLTLLPAAAWAEETGTNGDETCVHDWEWVPTDAGYNHISKCKKCTAQGTTMQHDNASGYCSFCHAQLKARVNESGFYTSLQKALHGAGSNIYLIAVKQTVYPIGDQQESITYSETVNENVTLNLNRATIESLTVTAGTLKIEGSGAINTLTVTGGTVQLSGGTYGTITPPAGKSVNDLLAPGYYAVSVAGGKTSVQQAPITEVKASVSNNENTVYGYSEVDAPVLTATVTPSDLQGVTYQWYKVNDSKKTAIDNATAQTYTVETGLNAGNYDYCCTATVDTYSLTSEKVKVTIAKADGPQLGTINVNQVYNDTASKTINIYDYIGTDLNKLAKDAGTLRFHTGTYSPEGSLATGWSVFESNGAITYQLAEGLSVGKTITITITVGYNDQTYSKNHEDATVTVNITLTKITPTGTPNYTPITSSGKTLADAHLNADNKAFSVPGTVKWVGETDELDPSTVPVEKDKAYTWKFTPQLDNCESITGSIILWTESGSGVVIIVPSQSGESTPASNPNTGAAHVGQPLPGLALLALAALCLYAGTRRF